LVPAHDKQNAIGMNIWPTHHLLLLAYFSWPRGVICNATKLTYQLSTYQNHKKAIQRLYDESLYKFVEFDKLDSKVKVICERFDESWNSKEIFKTDPRKYSTPGKIFRTNERIRLANSLLPRESDSFESKYLIPPLSEYLLLTCADNLGQQKHYISFDQWLVAKKCKNERDLILYSICSEDPIEVSKQLFKGYQKIYGVRNSFMNFFNELISENEFNLLKANIRLSYCTNYPDNLNFQFHGSQEIKNYLYSIRNDFTHKSMTTAPSQILFPEHTDEFGWYVRDTIHDKDITTRIEVREAYLQNLEEIIQLGLWKFIDTVET